MSALKRILPLFAIALLLNSSSCNKDEEPQKLIEQELGGKINGSTWTYSEGVAINSGIEPGEYVFNLYKGNSTQDLCTENPLVSQLSFTLPLTVKTYTLGTNDQINISFIRYSGTLPVQVEATTGSIEIREVTSSSISGYMDIYADGNNQAKGKFELDICL